MGKMVDRAPWSGGPRAGGGSRVHGGPADEARPELTGVRVHQRSGARDLTVAAWGARGEDGDPYPGGASGRRGSDGRASAKGGGGGANSTTRGLGREGGERGADLSVVKMVGGVAPFYRVREAVKGSGGGAVRGTAGGTSSTPITGVEARGRPFDEGGNEGEGTPVRFNSN
jgi:hypothetical protein